MIKNDMEIKFSFLVVVLILIFSSLGNIAKANDSIKVEDLKGSNIGNREIFHGDNIYPGWETTKTIRIKNESATDKVNLFFTFDLEDGNKLAKALKLYVVRVPSNDYRIGGQGDKWTLKEADGKRLYADELKAGEDKKYKIKIKLDEDADNEYQDLKVRFGINFKIESQIANSTSKNDILASEGRVVTGKPPIKEVKGEQTKKNKEDKSGLVSGAEKKCQNWPQWVWVLALVIFVLGLVWDARRNYKKEKYAWKLAVVWMVVALIFWYFFDFCHQYRWFLSDVIITTIIIHFIYLASLKKKVAQVKNN